MQNITTYEPLKGQDLPTRVRVVPENRAYLQATSYLNPEDLCIGRPVEELPRILSIRSPAHHLAAARLLDQLFGVKPPDIAQNMRDALLHSLTLCHHLRKLLMLVLDPDDPFPDHRSSAKPSGKQAAQANRRAGIIMRTLGLAQEAAAILGGRSDHPLTAIAGGVSRFLKDGYYERLGEIAAACVPLVQEIDVFFREDLLADGGPLSDMGDAAIDLPATAMFLENKIIVQDGAGKEMDQFPLEKSLEKIEVRVEPWSRLPFASLKTGDFMVGPIARMGDESATNGKLTPADACRALTAELVQTAEAMIELYQKKNFVGPAVRTVPEKTGTNAWAALEGPAGLIVLGATVDGRGVVESIQVIDPILINNGIRCQMAQAVVAKGLDNNRINSEIKRRVENSLLPF